MASTFDEGRLQNGATSRDLPALYSVGEGARKYGCFFPHKFHKKLDKRTCKNPIFLIVSKNFIIKMRLLP